MSVPSDTSPAATTTETVTTDATEPTGTGTITSTTDTTTTAETATETTTDSNSLRKSPVFDYENLSAESQADFRFILNQSVVETDEPLFAPSIADAHYNLIRVRYHGRVVEIRHQRQLHEARTCLVSLSQVNESSVDDDATVRAYANLSDEGRALFRSAVDGNTSNLCYPPLEYPLDARYVRYHGQYYALVESRGTTTVYFYSVRTD